MSSQDPREDAGFERPEEPIDPQFLVALARVRPPAILLIVVGVLNLLGALYLFFSYRDIRDTDMGVWRERWEEFRKKQGPGPNRPEGGIFSPEGMREVALYASAIWGILTAIIGMLGLWGGVRMLSLRSYPLALTSAIVTAIPCLAFPTSCLLLGEAAGIWAIVVLLNGQVRAAFE
jgi:hypothetical protein